MADLRSKLLSHDDTIRSVVRDGGEIKKGDWGDAVRCLQAGLIELGFHLPRSTKNGSEYPDGIFSHDTVSAIAAFQLRESLPSTGIADAATIDRLDLLLWRNNCNLAETQRAC